MRVYIKIMTHLIKAVSNVFTNTKTELHKCYKQTKTRRLHNIERQFINDEAYNIQNIPIAYHSLIQYIIADTINVNQSPCTFEIIRFVS